MKSRLISLLGLWLAFSVASTAQPRHLYLTWEDEDTAHTQTIVFQTLDRAQNPRVEIRLDAGSEQVTKIASKTITFGGLARRVHWVTVRELKPSTKYVFRAGDDRYGMSKWRSLRTLPDDGRALSIAAGGDMYRHQETVELLQVARTQRPDVAMVGGDIAYADGDLSRINFWDDWLDNWEDYLNPKDGPLVPMILAIGNHEVRGGFDGSRQDAPFYFALFPQGGSPYFQRRLGSDIQVTVLDTGHVTTYEAQVPFLETSLKAAYDRKVPFHLALYHVPCYPTQASPTSVGATTGRQLWVPLFDRYRLTAGLENHDHVLKRTHPLKGHKVNPEGTVYLGDGCWGRTPRAIPQVQWYHAKASSTYHVWLLRLEGSEIRCQAFSLNGAVVDKTTLKARFRDEILKTRP
jgi:hypothetical protein